MLVVRLLLSCFYGVLLVVRPLRSGFYVVLVIVRFELGGLNPARIQLEGIF